MLKSKAYLNMEESDAPMKTHHKNSGCHSFLLGVATALSIMSLTLVLIQVTTSNQTVQVTTGELVSEWPTPPPHDQVARVARYVVHISDWASVATISTHPSIISYPFANVISMSDGPVDHASGVPYMYMTRMDLSGKDLLDDARATLSLSEAQSTYCQSKGYDPEDPRCARILLTGSIIELKNGTSEAKFAENALFSRHPVMKSWPAGHHWFFAKMNITHIFVLDFFGGASEVDVDDYFKAIPFI